MSAPFRTQKRERPHRLPPDSYRGIVAVSFTICTSNRNPFLTNPEIVTRLLRSLEEAAKQHRCAIAIYVFMPDHLHVMTIGLEPSSDARGCMNLFKFKSGYWLSRQENRPCWQKDYYDHILREDSSTTECIRYIANNPVRAGLVEDAMEWPYLGAIGFDLREVLYGANI